MRPACRGRKSNGPFRILQVKLLHTLSKAFVQIVVSELDTKKGLPRKPAKVDQGISSEKSGSTVCSCSGPVRCKLLYENIFRVKLPGGREIVAFADDSELVRRAAQFKTLKERWTKRTKRNGTPNRRQLRLEMRMGEKRMAWYKFTRKGREQMREKRERRREIASEKFKLGAVLSTSTERRWCSCMESCQRDTKSSWDQWKHTGAITERTNRPRQQQQMRTSKKCTAIYREQ